MDDSTSDLQSLASRIEKVERQNWLLKRIGLALILFPAALIVMGQARPTRTFEAQGFVVRDSAGNKRAELSSNGDAAVLQFFDAKGRMVSALTESSIILLAGAPRTGAIILNAANSSNANTYIFLEDSDGFSASLGATDTVIAGTGEKHKTSAASLTLFGSSKEGNKVLWSAP